MSARRQCAAMSRVAEWQIVTVALAPLPFWQSIAAIGLPTMLPRPRINHFRAVGVHAGAREQFHDARRRAGPETRRIAQHQLADVHRMKTVHVFCRQNGGINLRFGNLFRQRCLDEDSVQARIGIQFCDQRQQVRFRSSLPGRTWVSETMPSSAQAFSLRPT